MNVANIIRQIITFIVVLALQVFFFRYAKIFGVGFCFFHIAYILMVPKIDKYPVAYIVSSFLLGFGLDILETTPGIHAASCALIAFVRPQFLTLFDLNQYENQQYTVRNVGFVEYALFGGAISFIYTLTYFTLESFDLLVFFKVGLFKSIISAVYTILVIIIMQYLLVRKYEGE